MSKKNEHHEPGLCWKELKNVSIDITSFKSKKKNAKTVYIYTRDGDILLKHKTARILAKFILANTIGKDW